MNADVSFLCSLSELHRRNGLAIPRSSLHASGGGLLQPCLFSIYDDGVGSFCSVWFRVLVSQLEARRGTLAWPHLSFPEKEKEV